MMDREGPRRRPDRRTVMYQKWRSLLFLHWEVAAEEVARLLPAGLELDLYEGKAYVGLVPFAMEGVRPVGLPAVPGLSNFHETNVRTYVHVGGKDPGVWFFSLDAANPLAVEIARGLFHLPYYRARMSLTRGLASDGRREVAYWSERRDSRGAAAGCAIECRVSAGEPVSAVPGSVDFFLLERYLLYTSYQDRLWRGQVHHTPYPVQSAEIVGLEETMVGASGISRANLDPLVHYAEGVDVEIFWLERVC